MVWIVGGAITVAICLLAFPKQAVWILAGVVLAVGALIFYFVQDSRRTAELEKQLAEQRAREFAQIEVTAGGDATACPDSGMPIAVTIKNGSATQTLKAVTFNLEGHRRGFSSVVSSARNLSSDKIIEPGGSYTTCWPLPPYSHIPDGVTAQMLEWTAIKQTIAWM
ncbi:hypothetical protein PY365_04690 [Roseiarcaceae bacterium H3SJ34-1]|uniref:hypothetical protein n=1 Tax=Terripilifer ovatus TaxID=3032367 RepID=UPI003AB9A803|nr:hypothetical protein [Roseiarcaceae bacterium H3SJ34-1]